jgi:hypothetical protein
MDMGLEVERWRPSLVECCINSGGSSLNELGECRSKSYGGLCSWTEGIRSLTMILSLLGLSPISETSR